MPTGKPPPLPGVPCHAAVASSQHTPSCTPPYGASLPDTMCQRFVSDEPGSVAFSETTDTGKEAVEAVTRVLPGFVILGQDTFLDIRLLKAADVHVRVGDSARVIKEPCEVGQNRWRANRVLGIQSTSPLVPVASSFGSPFSLSPLVVSPVLAGPTHGELHPPSVPPSSGCLNEKSTGTTTGQSAARWKVVGIGTKQSLAGHTAQSGSMPTAGGLGMAQQLLSDYLVKCKSFPLEVSALASTLYQQHPHLKQTLKSRSTKFKKFVQLTLDNQPDILKPYTLQTHNSTAKVLFNSNITNLATTNPMEMPTTATQGGADRGACTEVKARPGTRAEEAQAGSYPEPPSQLHTTPPYEGPPTKYMDDTHPQFLVTAATHGAQLAISGRWSDCEPRPGSTVMSGVTVVPRAASFETSTAPGCPSPSPLTIRPEDSAPPGHSAKPNTTFALVSNTPVTPTDTLKAATSEPSCSLPNSLGSPAASGAHYIWRQSDLANAAKALSQQCTPCIVPRHTKSVMALDCEGVPEELLLLQLATPQRTYIFDCLQLGAKMVCAALAPVLECPTIVKLAHDVHCDAIALSRHGLRLQV